LQRILVIAEDVQALFCSNGAIHESACSNPDSSYNADEWVGTASAQSCQTWRQKEIMVVDHGSTDGILAVERQFESNEVRVVTEPNQGAAAARVPSAGDTANPDELKDDPGKYDHLEELAERFFAAKRRHLRHHSPGSPEYPQF
jgi:hypothetical protein